VSLNTHTLGAIHATARGYRHDTHSVAAALMLAASAVATFDLYLLAASAIH
jgi:hypothetical protein